MIGSLSSHGRAEAQVIPSGLWARQLKSAPGLETPQFHPRVEISIVLENEAVDEVVDVLVATARTGSFGDGKIFILPVENAIRIRTGERGVDALY